MQFSGGGGSVPTPWYDRGLFWGHVALFLFFGGLGCGAAMSDRIVWAHVFFIAAWPWGLLAAWLAINGLTRNRRFRIGGRITAAIVVGIIVMLVDRTMTRRSHVESPQPAPLQATVNPTQSPAQPPAQQAVAELHHHPTQVRTYITLTEKGFLFPPEKLESFDKGNAV